MFSIIVAVAENNAIGKNNDLIWHISEDLKRFKKLTTAHSIIMGRKTFESLPNGALPNRENIVLTRDKHLHFDKCTMFYSIDEVIEKYAHTQEEVFVIGGNEDEWEIVEQEKHDKTDKNKYAFSFINMIRK